MAILIRKETLSPQDAYVNTEASNAKNKEIKKN